VSESETSTSSRRAGASEAGHARSGDGLAREGEAPRPAKASIREALGIAYFRLRRYEEAESEFRALVDFSPADDYAHYGLARALEKLGRTSEARGHLKLARSLRPGSEHYAERLRALE
jgi:Flp pilus assembly protein TadD